MQRGAAEQAGLQRHVAAGQIAGDLGQGVDPHQFDAALFRGQGGETGAGLVGDLGHRAGPGQVALALGERFGGLLGGFGGLGLPHLCVGVAQRGDHPGLALGLIGIGFAGLRWGVARGFCLGRGGPAAVVRDRGGVLRGAAERVGVAAQFQLHRQRQVRRGGQAQVVQRRHGEADDLGDADQAVLAGGGAGGDRLTGGEAGIVDAADCQQRGEEGDNDL
ncbi:hypothetical protein [Rhodopila sp.]|uniref:hypothetical protein n=1 Tax=Rhodopila sp. TaxID=2480087 RepID=UPI003D0C3CF5